MQQRVVELFCEDLTSDNLDFNHDGVLNQADVEFARSAYEMAEAYEEYEGSLTPAMQVALDVNGDGVVNEDDAADVGSSIQTAIDTIHAIDEAAQKLENGDFDLNNDGRVDNADIAAAEAAVPYVMQYLEYLPDETIAQLDIDNSGTVDEGDMSALIREMREEIGPIYIIHDADDIVDYMATAVLDDNVDESTLAAIEQREGVLTLKNNQTTYSGDMVFDGITDGNEAN